jgi:hypothetical protein
MKNTITITVSLETRQGAGLIANPESHISSVANRVLASVTEAIRKTESSYINISLESIIKNRA